MFGRQEIHEGMTVRARDGEKLGRVHAIEDRDFIVEKGLFFPKEYIVLYDDVMDVRDEDIILRSGLDALRSGGVETAIATGAAQDTLAREPQPVAAMRTEDLATQTDDLRMRNDDLGTSVDDLQTTARAGADRTLNVPIVEEELEVSKRDREVGAVHIKKEVVQETRTVEVPIRKEVVHVERVAVSPGRAVPPGTDAPAAAELRVPLHEEEIMVTKTPVIKEEVRVHTGAVEERRAVAEEVRREDVAVTQEGGVIASDDDPRRSLDDDLRRS